MNSLLKSCFYSFLFMIVCSCASAPSSAVQYDYGEGAISLNLKADSQLNRYNGVQHTLSTCVYQLSDSKEFNQLSSNRDGLYRLLGCEKFDPSVKGTERVILHPGKDEMKTLDRVEGSRFVAVAAGYYNIRKDEIVRIFEVPVVQELTGFLGQNKISRAGDLNITLSMGPQQIKD